MKREFPVPGGGAADNKMPKASTGAAGPGRDDETWLKAKAEHDTVGKILDALRPLSENERRRVLNYFWDKYVTHPDPE